jgi:glutamine synthetase
MNRESVIMLCCSDISGQLRGKGFPASHLEARRDKGVGWTPTNVMITAHGPIADTPWGSFGDLLLRPDMDTRVHVLFGDDSAPEHFVIGDIHHLDGRPWECCLRNFLKRGLEALEQEAGLQLKGAFEHEFHYDGVSPRPGSGYTLDAFRRQGIFGEVLIHALRAAHLKPDTIMAEYGPCQYEVTVDPAIGVTIADQAVILREMTRASAIRLGHRASFTPIVDPASVGNGVHVHFSLQDLQCGPVNHDPEAPAGISSQAGAFLAGIQAKLPALCALTAASTISYLRLTPHRWSAAYNNLASQDREAGLRICPVFGTTGVAVQDQFHFEYRAADAAASPYLLLGALVWAGVLGIRKGLKTPALTEEDLSTLTEDALSNLGLQRLPQSLGEALDLLEIDDELGDCLGPVLLDAYLRHKRFEIDLLKDLSPEEQCARYHQIY